ncbi:MAG: nucleotidyltransferase [bacterium]
MKPSLLILAAGIGSRYGGLKQLDAIGPRGETIIDYSIYDAIRSGFGKVVFVIKESIEQDFREVVIDKLRPVADVDFVHQEIRKIPEGISVPADRTKPWGTGHAILMAEQKITGPFAVINSDDFYGRKAYQTLAAYYQDWTATRANDYSMVAYEIGKTLSDFGAVSRGVCQADDSSFLMDVVERTQIEKTSQGITFLDEEGKIVLLPGNTIVSMNFWGFTPSFFGYLKEGFEAFLRKHSTNPKAEFYIPSAVNKLIREQRATVKVLRCNEQWFGMTYKEDRAIVADRIRKLIEKGEYPEKLWS